jgi:hypothetical protein
VVAIPVLANQVLRTRSVRWKAESLAKLVQPGNELLRRRAGELLLDDVQELAVDRSPCLLGPLLQLGVERIREVTQVEVRHPRDGIKMVPKGLSRGQRFVDVFGHGLQLDLGRGQLFQDLVRGHSLALRPQLSNE